MDLSLPSDFHRNCRCVVEISPEILDVLEKIVPKVGCSGPLLLITCIVFSQVFLEEYEAVLGFSPVVECLLGPLVGPLGAQSVPQPGGPFCLYLPTALLRALGWSFRIALGL